MAAKTYVSARDGVMVRCGERFVTVNRGGEVPADADQDHLQVLVDRKLVIEGAPVAGFALPEGARPPFDPDTAPADHESSTRRRSSAAKES